MPVLMLVGGLGFCLLFMVSHRFGNGSEWSEAIFHAGPVTALKWLTPCVHTVAGKCRKTEEIQAGNVEKFCFKKLFYMETFFLHFNIQIDPLLNKITPQIQLWMLLSSPPSPPLLVINIHSTCLDQSLFSKLIPPLSSSSSSPSISSPTQH